MNVRTTRRILVFLLAIAFEAMPARVFAQENGPAEEGPTFEASVSRGLRYHSADPEWSLHLGGRFIGHVRGVPEDSDLSDAFTRQALVRLDAEAGRTWRFQVTGDFTPVSGELAARIKDAFVDWSPDPAFSLRLGQSKVPVGSERTMTLLFIEGIERPMPAFFQPAEEIALIASGSFHEGRWFWSAAMSDGRHDIVRPPTTADGEASLDASTGRTTAKYYLRGGVRPFPQDADGPRRSLEVAVFGSTGLVSGIDLVDGFRIRSPELAEFWLVPADQEGLLFFNGRRILAGIDPSWSSGSFAVRGEYLFRRDRVDRPSSATSLDLDTHSWSGEVSWLVTGELKAPGERVAPLHPFDPSAGRWGAVDVFARIAGAHVDPDALETLGADLSRYSHRFTAYTVGANWWPADTVRLSLNVVLEDYHHSITLTGSGDRARSVCGFLVRFQVDF